LKKSPYNILVVSGFRTMEAGGQRITVWFRL